MFPLLSIIPLRFGELKIVAPDEPGPGHTPVPHLHCLAGADDACCSEWLPPKTAPEHGCVGGPDIACLQGSPALVGESGCPHAPSAASGNSAFCKSSSVNTEHSE